MSNSVRPYRQQPTRLPHPWDSPRKNTGVGCHFLLQCMKVKSESEVPQLCPTQRPHVLQSTRLLHPWDFPGKSTGVGCHCLLRYIYKFVNTWINFRLKTIIYVHILIFLNYNLNTFFKENESEVVQSCPTLCGPVDCSPSGSSIHGILQTRILELVATSFSRASSRSRDRTRVSHIVGRHFTV